MLTLENINDEYIQVNSEYLADLIQNPDNYTSLIVQATINCCEDNVFTRSISFDKNEDLSCNVCNNSYSWNIDLTTIAQANKIIKAIWVKNIITGLSYNILSTPINFTYYNTQCPGGSCTIQSLAPTYDLIFENAFDVWFENNASWSNVSAGFCGNTLKVCRLPSNFILTYLEYGDNVGTTNQLAFFNFGGNSSAFFLNEALYLNAGFFNMETLQDGIYNVKIKLTKPNGDYIEDSNCAFIDITTKCKVSRFIEGILENTVEANSIHMAHYALVNGSNCGCNCKDLCDLYKYIYKLLGNELNINNCGC